MIDNTNQIYGVDCRKCCNYDNLVMRCRSITECVNASNYSRTNFMQLWTRKPNVEDEPLENKYIAW